MSAKESKSTKRLIGRGSSRGWPEGRPSWAIGWSWRRSPGPERVGARPRGGMRQAPQKSSTPSGETARWQARPSSTEKESGNLRQKSSKSSEKLLLSSGLFLGNTPCREFVGETPRFSPENTRSWLVFRLSLARGKTIDF